MDGKEKNIPEHIQKHVIEEYLHYPEHGDRKETFIFKNAKHELEYVDHINCFVCGTSEQRQSHHIIERAWANKVNLDRVAWLLYNHRDYHGYCKRDFGSQNELAEYLKSHKTKEEALDCLYNQLILCKRHHILDGDGIHNLSTPSFDASLVLEEGFDNVLSKEEYQKIIDDHNGQNK